MSSRESPPPGVHSLDHFALAVPTLEDAERFYSAFGLEVRREDKGLGLYTFGQPHCWAHITEGPTKRLRHLSFGLFERDWPAFKRHVEAQGVPVADVGADALWLQDPDGTRVEVRVTQKSSPHCKSAVEFLSSPAGVAGAPKRSQAASVQPLRLAHILLFTRDVPATLAFYSSVLGLRLSDRSGDDIAFMHGTHGSDHHLIAFARSQAPGLHHCAWDVRSVGDVGLGAMQMAAKGYTAGWGLGRHVLGSNYFHYVRDPWHSYCEYSCDMDYIPAEQRWEAGDHDAEDAFYVWGPAPPEDWTHNHEADLQGGVA